MAFTRLSIPFRIFRIKILHFINLVHITVRSSVSQTRLHSCSKSSRTLLEFSPLSLYILKNTLSGVISKMERETRLELATPSLARKCSTTELLSHSVIFIIHGKFYFSTILFAPLQKQFHLSCSQWFRIAFFSRFHQAFCRFFYRPLYQVPLYRFLLIQL